MKQPIILHCHSQHSFLDGLSSVKEMVSRAKELGMNAIALTNHGNIFGLIEFQKECEKQGIKPILGMEVYVTPDHTNKDRHAYHLILLCENQKGLDNLIKLTSRANKNFYFKPRVDFKDLEEFKDGLIACTACMHGLVSYQLYDKMSWPKEGEESQLKEAANIPKAYEYANVLLRIFGSSNLFLEVQDGGIPEQKLINSRVRTMAAKLGINTIATQDFHYVLKSDAKAHSFLKAMAFGKTAVEEGSHGFSTDEFYIKSREEWLLNSDLLPSEVDRTIEISDRCNSKIKLGNLHMPTYAHLDNKLGIELLREKMREGWRRLNLQDKENIYLNRINREISDIESANLVDYFLIVSDITDFCRSKKIMLGPSRGSAGGSLVSYLLGITNIDPIKYNLVWERFYNAGRKGSMPDIDTDVEKSRREEVLEYIKDRFGRDRVAQLATLSSLGAKQAIRDVLKVAGVDEITKDYIASLIPMKNDDHAAISLQEAIDAVPELKKMSEDKNPIEIKRGDKILRTTSWNELFSIAKRIEGCYKNSGVHAAAVVISDKSFDDAGIPLVKGPTKDELVCGWDMDAIDALGFLKVDILGLATLSVINTTLELIKKRHNISIDIESIPLDDPKVGRLISSGKNEGIFQLESSLGKSWSIKCEPGLLNPSQTVEEVSDLVSLIRPAVLDAGLAESYVKRKRGDEHISYIHPLLEDTLKSTYGILLYQEQMMEIANKICKWDLKKCDTLRKVIGKKKPEELRTFKVDFINDATKTVGAKIAEDLWGWMENAAGYGFNRSHAMGYSLLAYRTAWLKSNYYIEFLCANLMHASDKANQQKTPQDVICSFINDARLYDVEIKPPILSAKNIDFEILDNKTIAFGLSHIKGVGDSAITKLMKSKDVKSFSDFLINARQLKINKAVIDALISCGALDNLSSSRKSMRSELSTIDFLTENEYSGLEKAPHLNMFDKVAYIADDNNIENMKKLGIKPPNISRRSKIRDFLKTLNRDKVDSIVQILNWEKQYLGTTLSGSLADLKKMMVRGDTQCCKSIVDGTFKQDDKVNLCVLIEDMREVTIKNGKSKGSQMAFVKISDSSYTLDGVCAFPDILNKIKEMNIQINDIVNIKGAIGKRGLEIRKIEAL